MTSAHRDRCGAAALARMHLAPALALALGSALLGGCPSEQNGDAKNPTNLALERRDTEMKHEDCDLKTSSASTLDANGDGKPDIITVGNGCRAVDINMDGVIDTFLYYDDKGQVRRRESGFDRDSRPDEIGYYEGGIVVRKERETNNDTKVDTWDYYQGGRLVREERDSTGDGFIDQWWSFNRPNDPDCAVVVSDGDGDGKPDEGSQIDLCKDGAPHASKTTPEPEKEDKEGGARSSRAGTGDTADGASGGAGGGELKDAGKEPAAEPEGD